MIDEEDGGLERDAIDTPDVDAGAKPAAEPSVPEWTADDEEAARALGWKDASEWQGEVPAGIIADPRRYLERAENFGPFRKLKEKLTAQEEMLRKLETVTAKQIERDRKAAEESYNREIAAVREAQRRAAEVGDVDEHDRLEKRREGLKPPVVEDAPSKTKAEDPTAPFHAAKPWLADPILRRQASDIIQMALSAGEPVPSIADVAGQIDFAEKRLAVYYPHLFQSGGSAPKPKPSPVAGDVLAPGRRRAGFDTLPDSAKSVFKRQVAQGIFQDTKEDREFFHDEYVNA